MEPSLQKALFDRVYEKRKAAALDLERQVRDCVARGDRARVTGIVQQLCAYLAQTPQQNANARNGGLIGLAGVAIALGQEVATYLDVLIDPILACFRDPDPKTRYFACESFYNIAKVCKGEILVYFNEVFIVLARLASDAEVSVKNGAELLDRLLKDIVCEAAPHYVSVYQDMARVRAKQDQLASSGPHADEFRLAREKAEHQRYMSAAHEQHDVRNTTQNKAFSLARLMPLLAERMHVVSPLTRNYLIGWVAVLDSVPDLQLVSYLSVILPRLFQYLSDPNTDVRVATAEVLTNFLHEIQEAAQHVQLPADDAATDTKPTSEDDDLVRIHAHEVRIEYDAIFEILLEHIASHDEEIQATIFEWITAFLLAVPSMVIPFTPRLISAILPCLAHPSPEIQSAAIETNRQLFQAVKNLPMPPTSGEARTSDAAPPVYADAIDYSLTTQALKQHLLDQNDKTRLNALEWLGLLHQASPTKLLSMEDGSFLFLLNVLSDPSEEVILCALRLLTQICSASDAPHFKTFIVELLEVFRSDPKLLETSGSLIVRQLCISLDTEQVFCTLAACLEDHQDLEFASTMTQNLNMILVASPELAPLRRKLRTLDQKEHQKLFVHLYRCWCHSAVSVFNLCLLTQAYEHAYDLLRIFGELEVSLGMLMQIDKLVQLLESPVFTALRLQLLEPETYPFLFKCLYGLMMLLPQSSAFSTLRNRVNAVNGLGSLPAAHTASRARYRTPARTEVPWSELLQHFRSVQDRHEQAREQPAKEAPASDPVHGSADAHARRRPTPGAKERSATMPHARPANRGNR